MMIQKLDRTWHHALKGEFEKDYFQKLTSFVARVYTQEVCYPPKQDIFAAFDHCTLDQLKVVILGQDPYHGEGQANGLCFSVRDGVAHPPSLKNIFKEIHADINLPCPDSGDLSAWARQGVFLLNATLTVSQGMAGSHQGQGWEIFTDKVIEMISAQKQGVVFLLWGGFAKKKAKLIDANKHHILTSGHPSPLSANRGYWFGHKHFSQANKILTAQKKSPIDWGVFS